MELSAPAPTPLAHELVVGDYTYTVLKLGTPVCSKSATASHLRNLNFTAADLTLVGRLEDNRTYDFQYVAWCTQTATQKLVTADLFEALMKSAQELNRLPVLAPPNREVVTLHDGRKVAVPIVPEFSSASASKKRKSPSASAPLMNGKFVLEDEMLMGGQVNPELKRIAFTPTTQVEAAPAAPAAIVPKQEESGPATAACAPSDARHAHLVTFAEMLLCITNPVCAEQLHAWARSALGVI